MFNNNSTKIINLLLNHQHNTTTKYFYPVSLPFYNYPPTQAPLLASQPSTITLSPNDKPIPTIQEFWRIWIIHVAES
jgi:hypothetical protein